jgi:hypothetical protein
MQLEEPKKRSDGVNEINENSLSKLGLYLKIDPMYLPSNSIKTA